VPGAHPYKLELRCRRCRILCYRDAEKRWTHESEPPEPHAPVVRWFGSSKAPEPPAGEGPGPGASPSD